MDDGLEIRKAAFECMYTLLETSVDRIDVGAFVQHLVDGLKDVYDIKMLCHLMLVRLSNISGPGLLEGIGLCTSLFRRLFLLSWFAQYFFVLIWACFFLHFSALDSLIEPLKMTVTARVKDSAVKQEVDRNEELIRSALRAVACLAKYDCSLLLFFLALVSLSLVLSGLLLWGRIVCYCAFLWVLAMCGCCCW